MLIVARRVFQIAAENIPGNEGSFPDPIKELITAVHCNVCGEFAIRGMKRPSAKCDSKHGYQ